jgi:hypothetical protein
LGEPWLSFLRDVDDQLSGPAELHCFGAFVLLEEHQIPIATGDLDFFNAIGVPKDELIRLAGRDSELCRRHKVYLDLVTIATIPDRYDERLHDMSTPGFRHLRLRAFERHDLILAKLARDNDRDREDLKRVATSAGLDPAVLKQRYYDEMRYQSTNETRDDTTLELWLEILEELKGSR